MKNQDISLNKHLLAVASKNLSDATAALNQVMWPVGTEGISTSIERITLALQQTINVVDKILDDL